MYSFYATHFPVVLKHTKIKIDRYISTKGISFEGIKFIFVLIQAFLNPWYRSRTNLYGTGIGFSLKDSTSLLEYVMSIQEYANACGETVSNLIRKVVIYQATFLNWSQDSHE
jgi:hypothetical protein